MTVFTRSFTVKVESDRDLQPDDIENALYEEFEPVRTTFTATVSNQPDNLVKAARHILQLWDDGDIQSHPCTDTVTSWRWLRAALEDYDKQLAPTPPQ